MQPTATTPPTGPGTTSQVETILEVSKVTKVTKQFTSPDGTPRTVLDNISFSLKKGEIVVLLGQSGAARAPCCAASRA